MSDVQMRVLRESVIPNDMIPTFWDLVSVGAHFRDHYTYARWCDEVRGYAPRTGFIVGVPLWAKAALWWTVKVFGRRDAIVFGRRIRGLERRSVLP